jgi:signal transduction histidine kinase
MSRNAGTPASSPPRESFASMAGVMAHEVNNLMTIVTASVELASAHPSSDRQLKQLQRAAWAANLATRLTRQALSLVRGDDTAGSVVDITKAIAGMDSLRFQFEDRNVSLFQELGRVPLHVRLDPEQLELSLINLIRNAADAMPNGGSVTIAVNAMANPARVEVAVADTGVGIPADIIERITEPFFTTKAAGHGAGLGLAVVRAFVGTAAGTMTIDTTPGKGTVVRLRFPQVDDGDQASGSADTVHGADPTAQ